MEGRPSQLAVWLHEMLAYGALIMLHNCLESMTAAEGRWRLKDKHFFNQRGAHLTALDYHKPTNMLVVAFSSGVFDLYEVIFLRVCHMSVARMCQIAVLKKTS